MAASAAHLRTYYPCVYARNENMKRYQQIIKMFLIFFKIGALTIGGGMAMLPVIHKEIVDKRKWMSDEQMLDVFAISQSMPGVIAINASIYVGYHIARLPGALIATFGVVLPSFLSILLILTLLSFVQGNIYVEKALAGIRAAAAALILRSAIHLGIKSMKSKLDITIAAAAFILIVLGVNVVYAILMGAAAGLALYVVRRRPRIG